MDFGKKLRTILRNSRGQILAPLGISKFNFLWCMKSLTLCYNFQIIYYFGLVITMQGRRQLVFFLTQLLWWYKSFHVFWMRFHLKNYIRNSRPEIKNVLRNSRPLPKMGFLIKKTCKTILFSIWRGVLGFINVCWFYHHEKFL